MSIIGQAVTHLLDRRSSDAEKRVLQNELEHARELQRRILPEHEYRFERYDLYGISLAERIVGGDFFNYLSMPRGGNRQGDAVGDAASKGPQAAVQALLVSGALMMGVEYESRISTMLRHINTINNRIFSNDRFLTLFYCELLDGPDGLTLYANAGHCPPILYRAKTGECSELSVTGPILGLIEDADFSVTNCNILKGDCLVIYTDGITEANNGRSEFGTRRLKNIILKSAGKSAKTICGEIIQSVQVFSASGEYSDDKTVVVIKRRR